MVPKNPSIFNIIPRKLIFFYRKQLIARVKNRDIIIDFKYVICQKANSDYIKFSELLFYFNYLKRNRFYKIKFFSDSDFVKINKKRARFKIKIKSLELIEKIIF